MQTWSQKFNQVCNSDWIMCSDMSEHTGRRDDGLYLGMGSLWYMSLWASNMLTTLLNLVNNFAPFSTFVWLKLWSLVTFCFWYMIWNILLICLRTILLYF